MRGALLTLGLAAVLLGASARAESAAFGDWIVVCDNVRACTAFGFPADPGADAAYVRVMRGGGAADAPQVAISTAGVDSGAWRVEVDGRAVIPRLAVQWEDGAVYRDAELAPDEAAALLAALPNGRNLRLHEHGEVTGEVSLRGSSAALRWMDDRQGRAGTTTALVAKGPRPPSSIPAPPAPPQVRPAPPVSQARAPQRLPAAVKAALRDCDDDIATLQIDPHGFRLSPGVMLWQAPCTRGAYNIVYAFYLTDEQGRNVRPAQFPYEGGEAAGELMNAEFEPDTQTMSNFDKARGLGDCGALTSWVWTGQAFALQRSEVMPECRGVPHTHWPTAFVSRP